MRTLLDLAATLPDETLERYLDGAIRRGLIRVERLTRYLALERNAKRPRVATLRELVAMREPGRPIGSDLETIFFRALRAAGLPLPISQFPVVTETGRKYVDFAYPDARLAIELDGLEDHGTREGLERDYARQALLEDLGWRFRRFTWSQVRDDADGTAIRVGKALGLRPVRWR